MGTKIDLNTQLKLNNGTADDSEMLVFGDYGRKDWVGFKFMYEHKYVKLGEKDEDSEYFHLEKEQVGFLIDFLKRLYDNMQSEEHK